MTDAELRFHQGSTPDGFFRSDLTDHVTDADTITRELVQNGLDAAIIGAGRDVAEIDLSIVECVSSELPAFDTYVSAFTAAHKWRVERQGVLASNEQGVIDRMQQVLSSERCAMLLCRDNGVGLDQARMNDLMATSNSDKLGQGAGTSGVGHLTAFAASDLRYVLYAGRSGVPGHLRDVGGAHAILAPRKDSTGTHAADGFWMNPQGDLFERSAQNFPEYPPAILGDELNRVGTTGSVVGIAGFDCFRDDGGATAAAELMANAAAVNFLVAIAGGWLKVRVRPSPTSNELIVDQDSVHARLTALAQTRARRTTGRLHRSEALRASETLRDGEPVPLPDVPGAELRVRLLDTGSKANSRVQVFRDGMWITSGAPDLEPGDFGDRRKFDAVLSLTKGGPIYDLVRRSEGAEHRGIDKHRIQDDYDQLRALTVCVAEAIRSHVPPAGAGGPISPSDFAMVPLGEHAVAEIVPEYDPFAPAGDDPVVVNGDEEVDEPVENPHPPGPGPKPKVAHKPKVMDGFKVRSAVRPVVNADGTFRELKAQISLPPGERRSDKISVSVRITTGSDFTADLPLRPEWQKIESIQYGGTRVPAEGSDAYTIDIPQDVSDMTIRLAAASSHPHSVELNVVPAKQGKKPS